jgi:hypothetical protein
MNSKILASAWGGNFNAGVAALGGLSMKMRKLIPMAALAMAAGLAASSAASANTLCPSQATPGGFGGTSTNVSGPLDGACGANSAVKLDIPASTDYGKLMFESSMPGFPAGLTVGGLAGASANVAFSSNGSDQPYFLLPFVDSSSSWAKATPQIKF